MKQLLFVLMIALSTTAFGQHRFTGPQIFTGTLELLGVNTISGATTISGTFSYSGTQLIAGSETVSTHAYTLTGSYPLAKVTTTRLDTITLKTANYTSGMKVTFLTTLSTNDSTCFIPTAGSIMGGSYYWHTGAAGTYKSISIYYDGTNYYRIN